MDSIGLSNYILAALQREKGGRLRLHHPEFSDAIAEICNDNGD
jgi:hypothetical protein